ncbi:MAG: ATP-grasp domain-containing protein [Gammaproteobacteria bacterium]|nr:ATP-grasp domain-containing protein [Gammaproteobacteria bacterium]
MATIDRPMSYAAYSRFVDARYNIPTPNADWQSGRIELKNTEAEAKYLKALLEICDKEKITVIYPSRDPDIYICSKNKQMLQDRNILTPVPELDILLGVLDKGRTIELAQRAGFPCPKTILGYRGMDISAVNSAFGPPWIIKPRTSAGSTGMAIVNDLAKLQHTIEHVVAHYGNPLIQEYIPGSQRQNFYVLVDGNGDIHHIVCPNIVRYCRRLYRDSTAASLSSTEHPWLPQVRDFVRSLNLRGAMTVQTKIDARDNTPKLLEINAGIRAHSWNAVALGVNSPLLCLKTERKEKLPTVGEIPSGILFLDPIQDLTGFPTEFADWLVFWVRTKLLRRKPTDVNSSPPGPYRMLRSYAENYLGKHRKAFHPTVSLMLRDPKPNLLSAYIQLRYSLSNLRKVGT